MTVKKKKKGSTTFKCDVCRTKRLKEKESRFNRMCIDCLDILEHAFNIFQEDFIHEYSVRKDRNGREQRRDYWKCALLHWKIGDSKQFNYPKTVILLDYGSFNEILEYSKMNFEEDLRYPEPDTDEDKIQNYLSTIHAITTALDFYFQK